MDPSCRDLLMGVILCDAKTATLLTLHFGEDGEIQ